MQQLGHTGRKIDILKVDIEGSEWDAFTNIFHQCDYENFNQLIIELHCTTEHCAVTPRHIDVFFESKGVRVKIVSQGA